VTTAGTGQRGVIGLVERVGNRVPHPFFLFLYLLVVLAVGSAVLAAVGATAQLPGAPAAEPVRNVLSSAGLAHLLSTMVDNFVGFPPLGVVLAVMLGVGVAERTGFLRTVVAATLARCPARLMPFAVVYVGGQGHFMGDASMVILPPLAALAFRSVGRHPVAGALGAFAATSVGYGSGLIVGSLDANLAAVSEKVLPPGTPPGVDTSVLMNYWIQVVAALVLPAVVGWILVRYVEPGLTPYAPSDADSSGEDAAEVTAVQRRAMRIALLATLAFVLVALACWLVPGAPLQGDGGALVDSPFFDAIVPLIMLSFLTAGITYGALTGAVTRAADVPKLMAEALVPMLGFVVLAFSAGQFIEMFTWSRVGTWLAVEGSDGLRAVGLDGFGAMIVALVLCSVLAMIVFSGSSLWAVLGPVLVPVFVGLGLHPAVIQATYRIGDSVTNPISPLNPYLYVLLDTTRRYDDRFTLGQVFSRMALFVVPVTVLWVLILALFYVTDTPLGPGTTIHIG
jgi:aminobenzoyl-glutamate transport protein